MCEYCEKEKPILYDNIFDALNIEERDAQIYACDILEELLEE